MQISQRKQELMGEIFILCKLPIVGLLPIIINYTTKLMPPMLFASLSTFAAALFMFFYIWAKGEFKKTADRKALPSLIGVTLFSIVIPLALIFTGTSMTSSINTTLLLQTELFFTFIIAGFFLKEDMTWQKIVGASLLILGVTAVVYKGGFTNNWGNILIIAGTASYPIGNIFGKKALRITSPTIILFVRNSLAWPVLLLMSFAIEKYNLNFSQYLKDNFHFILINGILIYALSKILWYEGLKRLDISKAVPLGIASPVFSIAYAYLFLKEIPTQQQLVGLFVIFAGIFILTRKKQIIEPAADY